MENDNRIRALAEIASLDAWHKTFTKSRKAADLHVDVVFAEGRIGEASDSSVRFKLRLKRAEVVVVLPPTEPAQVDKESVSRDAPQLRARSSETRSLRQNLDSGATLKIDAKPGLICPSVNAGTSLRYSGTKERKIDISEEFDLMKITQIKTPDGDYAWAIEPTTETILAGRPWEAKKAPRMKINDMRRDRSQGIAPSIRVELRCRREDFDIADIALKNKTVWNTVTHMSPSRNKILAAEALIRTRLFQAGLLSGEIDDPYARLTICAIIAESQQ